MDSTFDIITLVILDCQCLVLCPLTSLFVCILFIVQVFGANIMSRVWHACLIEPCFWQVQLMVLSSNSLLDLCPGQLQKTRLALNSCFMVVCGASNFSTVLVPLFFFLVEC